jgi:predicted aspartyl protease
VSFPFAHRAGPVKVDVEIMGPTGATVLISALDTGATTTLINEGALVYVGYDPTLSRNRIQITTGSGVVLVPKLTLTKITALGQDRVNFPVLCHTLPPSAGIDSLLGLDFFRGEVLTLDFQNGQITLV